MIKAGNEYPTLELGCQYSATQKVRFLGASQPELTVTSACNVVIYGFLTVGLRLVNSAFSGHLFIQLCCSFKGLLNFLIIGIKKRMSWSVSLNHDSAGRAHLALTLTLIPERCRRKGPRHQKNPFSCTNVAASLTGSVHGRGAAKYSTAFTHCLSMGSSIVRLFQLLGHWSPVSIPTPSSDQRKHSVSNLFTTLTLQYSSSVDGGGFRQPCRLRSASLGLQLTLKALPESHLRASAGVFTVRIFVGWGNKGGTILRRY